MGFSQKLEKELPLPSALHIAHHDIDLNGADGSRGGQKNLHGDGNGKKKGLILRTGEN